MRFCGSGDRDEGKTVKKQFCGQSPQRIIPSVDSNLMCLTWLLPLQTFVPHISRSQAPQSLANRIPGPGPGLRVSLPQA